MSEIESENENKSKSDSFVFVFDIDFLRETFVDPLSELQTKQLPQLCTLPAMPKAFFVPQCVQLGNEILICGGTGLRKCYSYHVAKEQYKEICEYPREVILNGHNMANVKRDLCGAQAVVGGPKSNLLFITRKPKALDVINLDTFEYLEDVKDLSSPLSYHSFDHHSMVLLDSNRFLLICEEDILWCEFNEQTKTFAYQIDIQRALSICNFFGIVKFFHLVLLFGGRNGSGKSQRIFAIVSHSTEQSCM
ncbi:hypothetical protein RFI_21750 [Reticulomyxa filosa]|uniref:Uncharacterized protein n=1 Tax=Reticulomyxa filosa TaxID=46433 RepID=X6MP24_RETFI|nr:hypothetical protein RFI_21750 [Reticulomyxa filosa]|eukprot:ETO15614.1 hypothetical protein RFI_21750 [Reticulomyxa filosa]